MTGTAIGLAVALGCGLLIGIERERRKGQGPMREAAGVRSFAVAACSGALAEWLAVPGLVTGGALLVAALVTIAYARSQRGKPSADADPGLTTELALFTTYLIGVLAVQSPALGAACGAGLAALLASRERLHGFATQWLSENELHDGLLLAALALIVLPLVPPEPVALLGGMAPRPLAVLIVLILVLQTVAHVALRVLGARGGLPLVGFLSGFISSTATVATMGRRARKEPAFAVQCAAAAGLSGSATWLLAWVVVATLAPAAAAGLAPIAISGATLPPLVAWLVLRGAAPPTVVSQEADGGGPLRLREAVTLAGVLFGVSALVAAAARWIGPAATYPSAAIAALADAHGAVAALASLTQAGSLAAADLVWGVLLAVGSNTGMRLVVAVVSGGAAFARRTALALASSWMAAAGAQWLMARHLGL